MIIGRVDEPGPETKLAITRSSSERVKASSQPETSAGAMIGQGDVEEHPHRAGAQVHGRFFEAEVEIGEARLHHHRHVGGAEGGVRDDDGEDAAALRPADELLHGDKQQQQREAGDDVGHDQRRRHRGLQHGLAAEAAEADQRDGAERAQHQRDRGGDGGDLQAQPGGGQQLRIVPQVDIGLDRKSPTRPSPAGWR